MSPLAMAAPTPWPCCGGWLAPAPSVRVCTIVRCLCLSCSCCCFCGMLSSLQLSYLFVDLWVVFYTSDSWFMVLPSPCCKKFSYFAVVLSLFCSCGGALCCGWFLVLRLLFSWCSGFGFSSCSGTSCSAPMVWRSTVTELLSFVMLWRVFFL
ncbi:hypothetical protein O6H91_10G023200 [Diphasiastrum complanatum]|uniref:Uncharacterized protein n=1 Tax=Diphasiastrum complanatum TaxID=34168 RepID=A0ACC2CF26_DIPCM|nr:hypothetical protein O6H91_10G023200 [Diphasiastrum complanatum]